MLQITVPSNELFDEKTGKFVSVREQTLCLEHSLVSVSKWESKWHKAYFGKKEKTIEEVIDYIRCMTLTKNVNPYTYYVLTHENFEEISKYIENPMTATYIPDTKSGQINKDTITSELIYYWMFKLQIPKECEKWHIRRLITLIEVFNIKDQPAKSMRRPNIAKRSALNEARRKQLNTRG